MKKSVFLLGLLAISGICLTACGSKNYEMSFDEALEAASHSTLQDILFNNENVQQKFDITTNVNTDGTNIAANLQTSSKENTEHNEFDSSTKFNVTINSEESDDIEINGDLSIKLINEVLYLNLEDLNISGSEDISLMASMVEGFKNNWFYIPMSGINDISNGYLKNINELNTKTKEIVNNEGSVVYEGKFSQFKGYNARKISLNNEKIQEIINEYYESINSNLEGIDIEIPQLNIKNFEGYLVITGKNKVTIVIDNMDMTDEESTINANGFGGENYELNLSSEGGKIKVIANKNGSNYDIAANISDMISINGTITPKVSKSSINIKFDTALTIKAEDEGESDIVIPLKGSWSYESIGKFDVITPDDAQDLTKILGEYLGLMFGGSDYDYDYEDYDYEDYYEELEDSTESTETAEIDETNLEETLTEEVNPEEETPAE